MIKKNKTIYIMWKLYTASHAVYGAYMLPVTWAHLADVIFAKITSIIITLSTLPSSLFLIAPPLSSLCTVLLSCFLHFPFFFTLPCSASMLPWQQSYGKSLLPRPHERSSFHGRWSDGGSKNHDIQLWHWWRCHCSFSGRCTRGHAHTTENHWSKNVNRLSQLLCHQRVQIDCLTAEEVEQLIVDNYFYPSWPVFPWV